ncbi:MAG: hypothetical protein HY904_24045 [Deltaproteobacteria bacterium]|nr:hypothetical protein [Deltaproteobacteria bacterium]
MKTGMNATAMTSGEKNTPGPTSSSASSLTSWKSPIRPPAIQWWQRFTGSGALWKLWGNEVLVAPLIVPKVCPTGLVRDANGDLVRAWR